MTLFRRSKNTNKPVIRQISNLIPAHILTAEITKHQSNKGKSAYKTRDQFIKSQSLEERDLPDEKDHDILKDEIIVLTSNRVRFYSDKKTAFSNFCENIRVCLMHYLTLNYICNELKPIVKKAKKPPEKTLFEGDKSALQTSLPF